MPYKHDDCGGVVEQNVNLEQPPDPDWYGNVDVPHVCQRCGERFTITWYKRERRNIIPDGITHVDDRGVSPEAITNPDTQ